MPRNFRLPCPLALLLASAACDVVPPGAVTRCQAVTAIPPVVKTDILFVVDDSISMQAEQQRLATNFDAFIARLNASPFKNDFQIGITNTSVDMEVQAAGGGSPQVLTTYDAGPNQGMPYPAGALLAVDPATGAYVANGPRILSADSPTLSQDFKRNVAVGTWGSGKEQGLLAARLALTDRIADGTNAGFLRPGARLAVIIVSDADDCSDPQHAVAFSTTEQCYDAAAKAAIAPVQDFVNVLRGPLAGERRDVVVGAITTVDAVTKLPAVTCTGPESDPADRYKGFVDGFQAAGLIDDICNPSFSSTLEAIAGLLDPAQVIPLDQQPYDWRMLTVHLDRADGTQVACALAGPGSPDPGAADAVYAPPDGTQPPRITFQNACHLQKGDQVAVGLLCAG